MTGIIHDVTQGSDEWNAMRKGRLTASCMGKILTPTGKLSAQAVPYARKLARECIMDDPHVFIGNKYTDWGNAFEDEARQAVAAAESLDIRQVGFVTHPTMPVFGASPDGLIYERGGTAARRMGHTTSTASGRRCNGNVRSASTAFLTGERAHRPPESPPAGILDHSLPKRSHGQYLQR